MSVQFNPQFLFMIILNVRFEANRDICHLLLPAPSLDPGFANRNLLTDLKLISQGLNTGNTAVVEEPCGVTARDKRIRSTSHRESNHFNSKLSRKVGFFFFFKTICS